MRRFTSFIAIVVAVAGLQVPPAFAARTCSSEEDQAVYDLLALRTAMTVLTLSCDRAGAYNRDFVLRFRPILQANDRAVSEFFRRAYGRAGESRKDTFQTDLANVMAQEAERRGWRSCAFANRLFSEMNGLRSMQQLSAYASARDLSPPNVSMCRYGR